MTADILKNLLALQASVHADDGDTVISALGSILERLVAFDDGELVVSLAADLHRRKLTTADERLVLPDVLERLASHATALRIDDRDDAHHLPETRALLEQRGWRSLLAVPMSVASGTRGAVVLVARPPCAFAGAPLSALGSLATGAGLSLHHALKLSGQHDEVESLRSAVREERAAMAARVDAEAPLVGERQALIAEVAELRRELARMQDDLARRVEECERLTAERDAIEAQRSAQDQRALITEARAREQETTAVAAGPAATHGIPQEGAPEGRTDAALGGAMPCDPSVEGVDATEAADMANGEPDEARAGDAAGGDPVSPTPREPGHGHRRPRRRRR